MEYNNISNNSIYGTYTGSYAYQAKQYQAHNQKVIDESIKNNQDSATISDEAKKAMSESKTQMLEISDVKHVTGISKSGYTSAFEKTLSILGANDSMLDYSIGLTNDQIDELKNHFSREEGTRTDTFSKHMNKMVAAYQMMSGNIDEKYANPDRETEYYLAEDGSVQELTKEKEQEMLDYAYQSHSTLMANYTENLNTLTGVKPYEIYTNGKGQTIGNTKGNSKDSSPIIPMKKREIKNAAYQAFMSAIGGNNISKLMGTEGSWNHVKLDLGISDSQVSDLNKIWDYYANQRL